MTLGRRSVVALLAAPMLIIGCASTSADSKQPSDTVTTETLPPPSEPPVTDPLEVPAGVRPSSVILAAVLIASGGLESAVASGLVTPDEVDAARAAIEAGTLDEWVRLARGK